MKNQSDEKQDELQRFISEGTPDEVKRRYFSLVQLSKKLNFGNLETNLVVLDTETTGFSYSHDELIQIAAARYEYGQIVDWFVTFVNPCKPIPDEVVYLTGIKDEDVSSAPQPSEALAQLVDFIGDAKIVAHNVEFDRTFLTNHNTGKPLDSNIWIDSLDLARIAMPRLKSHRLLDLVKAFGAPLSTHRADADVEATCAMVRVLFTAIYCMPYSLVKEISGMGMLEDWETRIVFEEIANLQATALDDVSRETSSRSTQESQTVKKGFSLRSLRNSRRKNEKLKQKIDAEAVVKDLNRDLEFPSVEYLSKLFSCESLMGFLYDDYEPRQEQIKMSQAIRSAFAESSNLIVEAGTGVGKSMAYLIPSVLIAKKNNITIGVATKTNVLLDQIMYKELPALDKALSLMDESHEPLSFVSLKGFSHYLCLNKIERMFSDGPQVKNIAGKSYSQAPSLAALYSYIEQTDYDDMDVLKLDYRSLPRWAISTTSNDCLRRKCPYFKSDCFIHGSRRAAEAADIVVTNHSLFFCDLAADGGLLPPVRYWTLDEAHNAESEARSAFSEVISAEKILRIVKKVDSNEASKNVFVRAERKVVTSEKEEILFYSLISKARSKSEEYLSTALDFTAAMKDLLFFDTNKQSKSYESVELWLNHDIRGSATFKQVSEKALLMSCEAEKLVSACQDLVAYLETIENAAVLQREISSIALELKGQINAVDLIFSKIPDSYVYSATLNRKKDKPLDAIEARLLNVGAALNDTLYTKTHSVAFTSATLSISDKFDSFENAVGFNTSEFSQGKTYQFNSHYDYENNMTIYVVEDIVEPSQPMYLEQLQKLLIGAHKAQQGSILTLFTNRREMEKCFNEVYPSLKEAELRLVCQKWGVSVKGLKDDFLTDRHLSLFALKSFWEGFDAPGSTLRGVVIPKLPFSKPSDPLSCERATRDDQAWRHYVLPAAVMETKQAVGRLIRKEEDKGVIILADKRLLTKSYGKAFLTSLPSKNIKIRSIAAIIDELESAYTLAKC